MVSTQGSTQTFTCLACGEKWTRPRRGTEARTNSASSADSLVSVHTKSQLLALAEAAGVDVRRTWSKTRLAEALAEAVAEANPAVPAEAGAVESKVQADLDALVTTHPMGEALAEMSLNLARTLDAGAGLAVAAVNRELRSNLVELARQADNDEDLDAALSTPVRDDEDS